MAGKGTRRPRGEGTIILRRDGRYEARLTIGGQRRSFYGRSRREVEEALIAAKRKRAEEQITVDVGEERYEKVKAEAERRGVSVEDVILDALDALPSPLPVRRAALEAILAAEPMPVPEDPADLRRALDEAHERFFA